MFPIQRRQEEEYYTRLEAGRRRQHEEAERKLLTPDEPGLYRPPLPRDYLPPSPASTPTTNINNSAPPPPPQRNTSYLKTQVASPDTIYTAKFVSYNDEEEEDEEDAGLTGQVKLSATRKSYGDLPPAQKPQPPPTARKPRPVSDGIFLSSSFQLPTAANANSTALKAGQPPLLPTKPSFIPSANSKGRDSEESEGPDLSPLVLRLLLGYSFSCFSFFLSVFVCSFSCFPTETQRSTFSIFPLPFYL